MPRSIIQALDAAVTKLGPFPHYPEGRMKRPRSPFVNYNTLRITDVSANLDWIEEQRATDRAIARAWVKAAGRILSENKRAQ